MIFNWSFTQSRVTNLLRKIGFNATLVAADGSKAKGYAVWDSSSKLDLVYAATRSTAANKQLYLQGSIKKEPKPGDYIQQGSDTYTITEVEAYRPNTVILAYRVVVQ